MKKLIALIVLAPCCAFGASMSTYPAKTTPVSADKLLISDSAASNATKNVTIGSIWENLPGTTFSATNLGWTSQSALETWLGWSFSGGASSLSQLSDWPSAVSATEVGYLDGVTSSIQTQINALTAASFSPTIQASTPSNSAATGPYINSSNNHFLYNISATGYYDLTAATYTAHTFDTTPSAFSFTDVADATLSTQYTALAQINGIDTGITCTGSGGTVAACTGSTEGSCGAFGSTSGSITNNQYVGARVTSSGSNSTAVNNTVTCGGVSDTYTVTTVAGSSYTSVFSDYFNRTDSGTIGGSWTSETDTGSLLSVSSNKLVWNGTATYTAGYVEKTFGLSYYKWKVSTKFKVNSISTDTSGRIARIFIGRTSSSDNAYIDIKSNGTTSYNQIIARIKDEGGTFVDTAASYTFANDTEVTIEMTVTTATGASTNDGSVDLKVNGSSLSGFPVTNLDNYGRQIDRARHGIMYLPATVTKIFTFDDFDFQEGD